jgi:hypothetical protein
VSLAIDLVVMSAVALLLAGEAVYSWRLRLPQPLKVHTTLVER